MRIFLGLFLATTCLLAQASDFHPKPPFEVIFSAYLPLPVSSNSKVKDFFVKGGVYRTFDLFCNKTTSDCSVWVYDIADEYCNSKKSAPSQFFSGFNFDSWSDIELHKVGSAFIFKFNDMLLYGPTLNSIIISITKNPKIVPEYTVTKITGIASAPVTTQGVPLQSKYSQLKHKVVCNLSFFPPDVKYH